MSEAFDPYHQWLGIAPEEQPPNHYRLLGIKALEGDPGVIEHAADRQMAHLRTFQGGKHAALSQRLLNEVAAAKICLLNPQKKAEYDRRLGSRSQPQGPQVAETLDPELVGLIGDAAAKPARQGGSRAKARQAMPWLIAAAVAVLLVAGIVVAGIAIYSQNGSPPAENRAGSAGVATSHAGAPGSTAASAEHKAESPILRKEGTQGTAPAASPAAKASTGPQPGKQSGPVASALPGPAKNQSEPAKGAAKPAVGMPPPKAETAAKAEPQAEEKTERLPVPDAESQQKVAAQIEDIYKLGGRTAPAAKLEAAKELLKAADDAEDKPAERFVLLRRAAELAADGGDTAAMLQALDLLAGQFSFDALSAKEKMLARFGQTARSEAAIQSFVSASTEVIGQAVAEERFDTGLSVARLVQHVCAQHPAGHPFRKQAAQERKQIESLARQFQAVAEAKEVLKQKPEDPEANLALGRWAACVMGDWTRALPHLAKGSDEALKQLAERELSAGSDKAEDQVALADGWYKAAKGRDAEERNAFLRHAGSWYEEAQHQVSGGLLKAKIDKRLGEIAALGPSLAASAGSHAEAGKPITRGRWVDLLAQVDLQRDAIFGPVIGQTFGPWQRVGREIRGGSLACFLLPVIVEGDYDLECEFIRTAGNDFLMFRLPVGPRVCDLFLSVDYGGAHGLGRIDGRDWGNNATTRRPGRLENGRPYRVQIKVRCEGEKAAIDAWLNGIALVHWSGTTTSLSPNFGLPIEPSQPVLLIGDKTSVTFHAARFRLVSGTASLLPPRAVFMGSKLLTAWLNDIHHWRVRQGQWRVEDGRFLGSGDSFQGLVFEHKLPANFILEFKMSVLDSMRPRCYFRDVRIGNESNARTIFLYDSAQGTPFPYEFGRPMQIRMTFQGQDVRLDIDGKPVAHAKRKAVLDEFLWIGGGDRTSQGTTAFWDFKVRPLD